MGSRALRLTGIVFLGTVAGKIMGFLREMLIAAQYGASSNTDAYLVAFTLPTLISAGLGAALTTVAVTLFADKSQIDNQIKARTFSSLNNIVFAFGTVVVLLCIIITPYLIRLLAPGFQGEELITATSLARIMVPMAVFLLLAGLYSGVLNAEGNFTIPALRSIVYNLCIIFCVVIASPKFGIEALAFGTLLGGISQALVQVPALFKKGYRFRFITRPGSEVSTALRLLLPILVGIAVSQVNQIIDRMFASTLTEGSISALSFGYRVFDLPAGLFISSMLTVAYPTLTQKAIQDPKEFTNAMNRSLSLISFVATPLAIAMITLREPLVRVIFMRGVFEESAVQATSIALAYYAAGFLALAVNDMLKRGFWANKDTKTPVIISAVAVLFNVFFNAVLIGPMGHGGLALGTSLAMILTTIALGGIACRKGYFSWADLRTSLYKTIIAGGVMTAGMMLTLWVIDSLLPLRSVGFLLNMLALMATSAIGLGLYYGITRSMKLEEVQYFHDNFLDPLKMRVGQLIHKKAD